MANLVDLRRKERELAELLDKIRQVTDGKPAQAGLSPKDRAYWEARKVEEQGIQVGIHRRQLEGELVLRSETVQLAARRMAAVKALLEQVPERICKLLSNHVGAAARKALRTRVAEMIEDVLTALAEEAESGYGPANAADEKTDV